MLYNAGHKFVCGVPAIQSSPIVYSYGSHKDQAFELALLELRPDSEIHIFELDPAMLPDARDPRIKYYPIGAKILAL
jgi:hypothetical protein